MFRGWAAGEDNCIIQHKNKNNLKNKQTRKFLRIILWKCLVQKKYKELPCRNSAKKINILILEKVHIQPDNGVPWIKSKKYLIITSNIESLSLGFDYFGGCWLLWCSGLLQQQQKSFLTLPNFTILIIFLNYLNMDWLIFTSRTNKNVSQCFVYIPLYEYLCIYHIHKYCDNSCFHKLAGVYLPDWFYSTYRSSVLSAQGLTADGLCQEADWTVQN